MGAQVNVDVEMCFWWKMMKKQAAGSLVKIYTIPERVMCSNNYASAMQQPKARQLGPGSDVRPAATGLGLPPAEAEFILKRGQA
jgi:hypothetical protein